MLCGFYEIGVGKLPIEGQPVQGFRFSRIEVEENDFGAHGFERFGFFRTSLKDIDLSDCKIERIILSDTFRELRGATINPFQAAELVRLLGVKVV